MLGVNSHPAIASTATRFTSSGIDRSNERSPASTCPTGIPHFAATSAQATVELTSPTTSTASTSVDESHSSNATITPAVWTAWLPDPTPRLATGSGMPSDSKKLSDINAS